MKNQSVVLSLKGNQSEKAQSVVLCVFKGESNWKSSLLFYVCLKGNWSEKALSVVLCVLKGELKWRSTMDPTHRNGRGNRRHSSCCFTQFLDQFKISIWNLQKHGHECCPAVVSITHIINKARMCGNKYQRPKCSALPLIKSEVPLRVPRRTALLFV